MPQPLHALGCHLYFTTRGLVGSSCERTLHRTHVAPYATLRISLSPGVRESSSKAQRWDLGTSASPSRYRHIYFVLVGLTQSLGAFLPTLTHTHWVGDCLKIKPSLYLVVEEPHCTRGLPSSIFVKVSAV